MALKVPALPLLAVRLILDLARERQTSGDPSEPVLPDAIVSALETAASGPATDGSYQVALQPADATALSAWCRAIAPSLNPAHAGVLIIAADTIDSAK